MTTPPVLLTPGPLTTSARTRRAMLVDWGSWDADFIALTAKVRRQLLDTVHGHGSHVVVPMQGSGTFSVEAMLATLVPAGGHVLVPDNGAYCQRAARIAALLGHRVTRLPVPEDQAVDPGTVAAALQADASIGHVLLVHCETSAGLENPLATVAAVCERQGVGLLVDAMSSFGALPIDARQLRFDALVAASGKCLEGVPGMGFVVLREAALAGCAGRSRSLSLDLHDQHAYMDRTGQWRFTPPTHVVAALSEALDQFVEEGGQPARLARYTDNCRTLLHGLRSIGLRPFLDPAVQAPIIVSVHAPDHPAYDFRRFYEGAKARGFLLYPGKLTRQETFRIGCIGAIGRAEMQAAVAAVADSLRALGVPLPVQP